MPNALTGAPIESMSRMLSTTAAKVANPTATHTVVNTNPDHEFAKASYGLAHKPAIQESVQHKLENTQ